MISELFANAKVYGRYVRTCNYDGPKSWSKVKDFILESKNKDILDKINKILGNWDIQIKLTSESEPTNNLEVIWNYLHGELKIYGDYTDVIDNEINNTWLKYHYALQPITIPKNNPLTLDKLLQIGFNLGRLSLEIKDSEFYGKYIDFYNLNRLDDLNTYIKISENHEKQIKSNSDLNKFISDINDFIICIINNLQTCSIDELKEEKSKSKSNKSEQINSEQLNYDSDNDNSDNDNSDKDNNSDYDKSNQTEDNSNNYKNKYLNYKNKYMQLKNFFDKYY